MIITTERTLTSGDLLQVGYTRKGVVCCVAGVAGTVSQLNKPTAAHTHYGTVNTLKFGITKVEHAAAKAAYIADVVASDPIAIAVKEEYRRLHREQAAQDAHDDAGWAMMSTSGEGYC